MGGSYDFGGGYSLGTDYVYLPADNAIGVPQDQHEVTVARAAAPLPIDYLKANGSVSWDLAASEWLGRPVASCSMTTATSSPAALRRPTARAHATPELHVPFGVKFVLKAPGAEFGGIGYLAADSTDFGRNPRTLKRPAPGASAGPTNEW